MCLGSDLSLRHLWTRRRGALEREMRLYEKMLAEKELPLQEKAWQEE